LLKLFLFGLKKKNKKPEHAKPPTPVQYEFRKGLFEKPSPDTRTIIAIRKLCKVLDDNAKELTIAVDNFNLDIHEVSRNFTLTSNLYGSTDHDHLLFYREKLLLL